MRSALLPTLVLLLAPAAAGAQTTGPSGPTGPVAANPQPPGSSTEGSSDVTQSAATVRGRVTPNGSATRVQFQYGTSTDYGLTSATQTLEPGGGAVDVQSRLERLTSGTTYNYRVVATNAAGVTRGANRTFRTASAPTRPSVASEPARDVTRDAATLFARVDPNRSATTYEFEFGPTSRYGSVTPTVAVGAGDSGVRVSARVGGLLADTTYSFRLRARNAAGSTLGPRRTFRTGKIPNGLGIVASPGIVRYTRITTVVGTVTGSDRGGVPVALERRNFPYTAGFAPFGNQQVTNRDGVVRFLVPPFTLASQFRLVAPSRGGVTSPIATVRVRAFVRLRARRLAGGRVRFTGTIAPGNAAGRVSLQRRTSSGRYVPVRRVGIRSSGGVGRFAVTIRTRRDTATYRAATRLTGGALVDARSATIRLRGMR